MALQIGDVAPDFEAETTEGRIRFHEWVGDSWAVLFSHPKNFTPVCTTELGYMASIKPEFDRRGVKIIGLAVDVEGDPHDRKPADNQTVRNVFVIGPDKKIKLILVYPMTTGRNFDEVLRVIDSLQLTAKHKVATPVNWKQGEDVVIGGSVSDEEAKKLYPNGWEAPRPYIRIVPSP